MGNEVVGYLRYSIGRRVTATSLPNWRLHPGYQSTTAIEYRRYPIGCPPSLGDSFVAYLSTSIHYYRGAAPKGAMTAAWGSDAA